MLLILVSLLLTGRLVDAGAWVSYIEPRDISKGGGVLFIYGGGFSDDNFNTFDPEKGNKIWLHNDYETLVCTHPVEKNWLLQNPQAASSTKLVCSVPARKSSQGSEWYNLKITVNGVEVDNAGDHLVRFADHKTPVLKSIDHRYGKPGDLVTVFGKIFTKNIGPGASDLDNFDEIDTKTLQNLFFGTGNCNFMDELGNPYGAYLDVNSNGDYKNTGNVTCKTSGTFVGPLNGTLLVAEMGQSIIDPEAFSVNSKGQAFFYHVVPDVTSVSPKTGSVGTFITIKGAGFDGYKDNTKVFVNNALCEVVSIDSYEIVCKSPDDTTIGDTTQGPRGLKYELWKSLADKSDLSAAIDGLGAAEEEFIIDGALVNKQMSDETTDYTGRLSGLFIAPLSGNFTFAVCSNDYVELYMSSSADPAGKEQIANKNGACTKPGSNKWSDPITLVEGETYYMEALHIHSEAEAGDATNFLQVSMQQFNTYLTNSDIAHAQNEKQYLYIEDKRNFEKQKITMEGVSSAELTFTHHGKAAANVVYSDGVSDWEENFKSMFQWQCTKSSSIFEFYQSAEEGSDKLPGQGGDDYRNWGENSEPFCGNAAWSKPWSIFSLSDWQAVDIKNGKYFCFAYKGAAFNNGINVLFRVLSDKSFSWFNAWATTNTTLENDGKEWSYTCVDLEEQFLNNGPSWAVGQATPGMLQIRSINFNIDRTNSKKDAFLDEVSLGKKEVTIERTAPAHHNTNIRMESITVTEVDGSVEVEFVPHSCQSADETFGLLGIAGATIEELSESATLEEKMEFLMTSNISTYILPTGGKVKVERLSKESPELTGTFSITREGKTVDNIPVSIPWQRFEELLETEYGLYGVEVIDNHWDKCYKHVLYWEFKHIGGDQPEIVLNTDNVVSYGDGINEGVITQQGGLVQINDLGADFFRLPASSSSPQVNIWVNGFLSSCNDADGCEFNYDTSLTPTIIGVTSALVDGNIVLTITGTGFTEDTDDFAITAGGRNCEATSATTASVTCTLENGPAGDLDIELYVKSKGKATGSVVYSLELELISISPSSGSVGGGTKVKIQGTGFPNSMDGWSNGSIDMGSGTCKIIETSYTQVTCITPPESSSRRKKRASSDIVANVNGKSSSGISFFYDSASTPTISTLSSYSASPAGGDELTITGTAFGYEGTNTKVTLNEAECEVTSWSKTEIKCTLPPLPHGNHKVIVQTQSNGYADNSAVSDISVNFSITGAYPRIGSHQGGTKIKISGSGFGDCSKVVFNIGAEHTCIVDEGDCSDTVVECTVTKNPTKHMIWNTGRHFKYGPGYKWEPSEITVRPGDVIQWQWNLPVSQEGTGISVHAVADSFSNTWDGKGFRSGPKSGKGFLKHTFLTQGTYFFNTEDVIEGDQVYMPGKVSVEMPSSDEIVEISATMNGIDATVLGNTDPAPSSGSCAGVSDACASASTASDKVEFTFASCLTAEITSIQLTEGKVEDSEFGDLVGYGNAEIKISGSGFGTIECQNDIMIGSTKCNATSTSATELTCSVDSASITSLAMLPVSVNVANAGSAVKTLTSDTAGSLYVMPKITSTSPMTGSWAGGSVLKFIGFGLNPDDGIVTINFGESPYQKGCKVLSTSANEISCQVPDFKDSRVSPEKAVPVEIYLSGEMVKPELDSSVNLNYTFSDDNTPTSSAVSPSEFEGSISVTVSGSGFGSDSSAVSVFLKSTTMSLYRVRRSVMSQKESIMEKKLQEFGDAPRSIHSFWKRIKRETKDRSVSWISAGSSRSKRSTDYLPSVSAVEFENDLEEYFHPLVPHVHSNTVKRSIDPSLLETELYHAIMETEPGYIAKHLARARRAALRRAKRSTDGELIEMSGEGLIAADVTAVSDTTVTFNVPKAAAGDYNVLVYISGKGFADASSSIITSTPTISSVIPLSGSIYGGQEITIYGNGFSGSADDTTVVIGSADCTVTSTDVETVKCITPANAEGSLDITVTSNGVDFPATSYEYSTASTPTVGSISPTSGSGPVSMTVTGTNFDGATSVFVGDYECTITASTSVTVSCDLEAVPGGDYTVKVTTSTFGYSNNDVIYTSELNLASVTPSSGSFGGGSLLTLTGVGFDSTSYPTITVCDAECEITDISTSEVKCLTPSNDGSGTQLCSVTLVQGDATVALADAFTYDSSLTPVVSGLTPVRGGTGGGTPITITGTGFASSGNKVTIDGSICDITSESTTEIQCLTNSHDGAIEAPVTVEVPSQGYAMHTDVSATTFYYIDRWSSIWTWGGIATPQAGEFIVITEGQTILLDTSTPVLKFLLIDGGKLMYDRDADGLMLESEFILIINGGALEIGTEEEPYLNTAGITLHGNVRCTELPIYGCKTIGVREGTLDLHGEFVPMTWTRLSQTALAGDTEIHLENGVNWKPGSEIVIATTGGRASMGESEKRIIDSVSEDGTIVTLTEALKYEHISISQTFGTHEVETRGEVGLLSRNVKVQGTVNEQFITEIPACEKPFVANEEAEQSCFHGKFGEEIGTDEFGAIILIHAQEVDKHLATARISYTEFTEVGQAFRVGRYPIHFHINGNVTGSYVRGNGIHRSYNRACTIHAVSNLVVEHNVAFNIKGLSFFIEDGVEVDNIVQYNLAVYTRQSNSLLNPDIQPGSFWVVNGNNIIRHNAVAGSTHFGFWYRILQYPDGPSRTTSYCPAKAPMGEFRNNSAHSNGLYGIWIFTAGEKGWTPQTGDLEHGWCNGEKTTATFGSFIAWNNEIGVEVVESGAIRFENMTLLDNEKSGVELIHPVGAKRQNGEEYGAPTFKDSIVIAHSKITENWENGDEFCTKSGVYSGWWGNDVENVEFYNFDRPTCAALTNCARCKPKWVSGKIQTSGLSFINSPNKISWRWTMDGFYEDLDGTLCGTAGCKVVQKRDIYDPAACVDDTDDEFSHILGGGAGKDWLDLGLLENETVRLDGLVCDPSQKFHTVGFNAYAPTSLQFNDVVFHNEFGSARVPWRKKPPYADGWAGVLPEGTVNFFFWNTMDHITNITYKLGAFHLAGDGDYLLLGHNFTQSPDVFTFNGEAANSSSSLSAIPTYETAENTDWYWQNDTKELSYILSNKDKTSRGGKPNEKYREVQFRVYRCLYEGCLPPPPPTIPPGRPTEFLNWSSEDDWASLGLTKPVAGASGVVEEWISIPPGVWMVLDEVPPKLTRLYIYGVLEIGDDMDNVLSAEIIMIQGDLAQLVAGFHDAPHTHKFDILLRGNHETPDQPLPNGPNLGAKALGVFGKLQLHGLDVGRTWTRLAQDASAGSNTITLAEDVDLTYWAKGAEIVISPTGYQPEEYEVRKIKAIAGKTITLNQTLTFDHSGSDYSLSDGSSSWTIAAEVGLLSRNIRIIGEDYPENVEEEFGARVLVGKFTQDNVDYRGYAKISNVEFLRAGQEGWTDRFDPRYSLAFVDHEDSYDNDDQNRESYVKKCAFNYNYNAAIGLFNTNNVLIEDNVVWRTLEYGLRDEGVGNRWIHNYITYTIFVGIHKDHRQNVYKRGCMILNEAWNTDFRFNAMSGCERGGLVATGRICSSKYTWEGNVIHSSHEGIHVNTYNPPIEIIGDKGCVSFDNFLIYKIYDYGVYLLTHETVQMDNNTFVDCGVGVHPFLIRPRPTTHRLEEKHLEINNTVFVGRSAAFDCDKDVEPHYIQYDKTRNKGGTAWPGRNWKGYNTGHAGLLWPIFSGIGVPLGKPWVNGKPKSFPLLTGQVYINDVTFANFKQDACGQFDSAIRTNPRGDDMQFPIFAKGTKFVDVDVDSKIWMDRPINKLVSNEHCVDMHCDGLKKALLVDHDGKIIGDDIPGTIIADAAYEWEGDPTAGLGYYRVPKTMITEVNGDRIEYSDKLPNLGIVRNDACTWNEKWHAFSCHDINHRLLIMESMDIDTLDRRLSPVAVLANPGQDGYIDLINGPQDWSCCFGYACQKRISNFYAIVGTNMMYEIHLTSTPPLHMRYRLRNNEAGDPILMKIFFPKPQRIDIFVGDRFVAPNNVDLTSDVFKLLPPDDSYIPSLESLVEGENYFDPNTGFLYVLLRGTETVDYRIQPSVVTKIGTVIDMDNFFEGDVAGNIAALLGVDPSLIKVTNVVREGSVRKKRESNLENVVIEVTIEPPPAESINASLALDYNGLLDVNSQLANAFQDGSMGAALNLNISTVELNEPIYKPSESDISSCIPQDEDPNAECYLPPEQNAISGVPYSQLSQELAAQRLEENLRASNLQVPTELKIMTQPGQAFELANFGSQPKLYTVDQDGNMITEIGTSHDPWIVTASLTAGVGNLINNVTCQFIDGYCEFTDLGIDSMGSGFEIQFEISYPTSTSLVPVVSDSFAVGGRPINVKVTALPTMNPIDQAFTCNVTAWDDALDQPAEPSKLPTSPVTCELLLFGATEGVLDGTTTALMTDGVATFDDLTISTIEEGIYLTAYCQDQGDFYKVALSSKFNIHSFPETGMLQETDTGFTYIGSGKYIGSVLKAYESLISGGKMKSAPVSTIEDEPLIVELTEEMMESWPEF